jgi:hypothetical protein
MATAGLLKAEAIISALGEARPLISNQPRCDWLSRRFPQLFPDG